MSLMNLMVNFSGRWAAPLRSAALTIKLVKNIKLIKHEVYLKIQKALINLIVKNTNID